MAVVRAWAGVPGVDGRRLGECRGRCSEVRLRIIARRHLRLANLLQRTRRQPRQLLVVRIQGDRFLESLRGAGEVGRRVVGSFEPRVAQALERSSPARQHTVG